MIPNIINLQERMTALEERVENHIKVPSWWNKRTDARLDALEAAALIAQDDHGPDERVLHLHVIAKLAKLLPGPKGYEVPLTPEESAVVEYAVAYAGASLNREEWRRHNG